MRKSRFCICAPTADGLPRWRFRCRSPPAGAGAGAGEPLIPPMPPPGARCPPVPVPVPDSNACSIYWKPSRWTHEIRQDCRMLVSKNKTKKACSGAFPFLPCPRARKQGHALNMKTLEINIGLNSKEFGVIHHETALNKLRIQGFQIIAYRLQESTCDDGDETCLAARVGLPEDWQGGLASLADKLGQDCIAIAGFAGARPYASFDASLWVSVDEDRHVENLARKTEFPWDHSDLVGICKWEAAKIRKARFDKQIGGGKFNA